MIKDCLKSEIRVGLSVSVESIVLYIKASSVALFRKAPCRAVFEEDCIYLRSLLSLLLPGIDTFRFTLSTFCEVSFYFLLLI